MITKPIFELKAQSECVSGWVFFLFRKGRHMVDFQWKYRVVKRAFKGQHNQADTVAFSIYEVYRDEKDNIAAIAARESDPSGETVDELKADIGAMLEAFQLPVLDYGQITEQIAKKVTTQ